MANCRLRLQRLQGVRREYVLHRVWLTKGLPALSCLLQWAPIPRMTSMCCRSSLRSCEFKPIAHMHNLSTTSRRGRKSQRREVSALPVATVGLAAPSRHPPNIRIAPNCRGETEDIQEGFDSSRFLSSRGDVLPRTKGRPPEVLVPQGL